MTAESSVGGWNALAVRRRPGFHGRMSDDVALVHFDWILPRRLAGMARPRPGSAPSLTREGVRAVLTLTEEPPSAELARAGLVVRHEPIADFAAPDEITLARCVAFVREQNARGAAVVVHCHAGYGRTGTVLAACLVGEGMDPVEAITRIRRARPGSIETEEQEIAVLRFARDREEPERPGGGDRT